MHFFRKWIYWFYKQEKSWLWARHSWVSSSSSQSSSEKIVSNHKQLNTFFMQITPTIKAILLSISGRSKKYGTFWLSRHEYEKYDTTQDKLRLIIKKLKAEWYILHQWYEKHEKFKANPVRCVYVATQKLFDLVSGFAEAIKDMNEKIVNWCKDQNPVQALRDFWIEVFKWGRIWKAKSSITINIKNGAIKDWKTCKTYNLYNYLRESLDCTHSYFFSHFIWN